MARNDDRLELGLPVPLGHRVQLPGRGTTFVRHVDGPPGAPTILLLHGWIASGGLNWIETFGPLSEQFRVLAIDHRGHGRGIRSLRRFSLVDCADDAAALLRALHIDEAIVVGYSMGGSVAQLMWQRHPHLVRGLALVATGAEFVAGGRPRLVARTSIELAAAVVRAGGIATWVPNTLARRLLGPARGPRAETLVEWAAQEFSRHSWRMLAEAGAEIATFCSKDWIHDIDVPTSVVVTTEDSGVEPAAQLVLASAIRDAEIHDFEGGHRACLEPAFGQAVLDVCVRVAARAGLEPVPTRRAG